MADEGSRFQAFLQPKNLIFHLSTTGVFRRNQLNYIDMEKVFQAVYKDGVLQPEEPLPLEEMQRVTVTIRNLPALDGELAGYFTPEEWAAAAVDPISWEDARRALSGISGSLSDAVTAQRQER